jgi:hypothetical protein
MLAESGCPVATTADSFWGGKEKKRGKKRKKGKERERKREK